MNILLVEDDPLLAESQISVLKIEGHSVIYARDGREGVTAALLQKPDMIITDYRMPNVNGAEFTSILRKLGVETQIIASTSDSYNEEVREELFEAGCNQVIGKMELLKFIKGLAA